MHNEKLGYIAQKRCEIGVIRRMFAQYIDFSCIIGGSKICPFGRRKKSVKSRKAAKEIFVFSGRAFDKIGGGVNPLIMCALCKMCVSKMAKPNLKFAIFVKKS